MPIDGGAKKRFKPPSSDDEIATLSKGFVPPNTEKNTVWAVRVFSEWRAARNDDCASDPCPDCLLESREVDQLNRWLPRFINEVRKQDGEPYLPRTVHQLLSGLQRFMLNKNPSAPKFLDHSRSEFHSIHGTCDTVYRQLHSQGVGTEVRRTPIITPEEEEKLWSTGVVGCTNPKNLQRAVFYYVGKCFCVRGGEEQRKLGPSQFLRSTNPDCYTYVERGSKNRSGGLDQLRLENKCVPCIAVPEKTPQCFVFLLDMYLRKLPQKAIEMDVLYCRPKASTPHDNTAPWYDPVPVGCNKLSSMVKDMCIDAGLPPKSNHSLRATGASTLFKANVPEKIIQKTTGHRSVEALRTYERVSSEQHRAVSSLLMSLRPLSPPKHSSQTAGVTGGQGGIQTLFGGNLTNCTIGNITVNVNCTNQTPIEREFEEISKHIELDLQ